MLRELSVEGLAVIEALSISFESGMTALTGETGTGKSVLLSALSLGLGARGDAGAVRAGCDSARVELVFDIEEALGAQLDEFGVSVDEEGTLVLSRVIGSDGRSRCRANGRTVSVSMLSEVGDLLADFHGQHEHQRLFQRSTHMGYIDSYMGASALTVSATFKDARLEFLEADDTLQALMADASAFTERLSAMRHDLRDIESAAIEGADEEAELLLRRERSRHLDRLRSAATVASTELEREGLAPGGDGAVSGLARAVAALGSVVDSDATLSPLMTALIGAHAETAEVASSLTRYLIALESENGDLDVIEERLSALKGLRESFGPSLSEVIAEGIRLRAAITEAELHPDPVASAAARREVAAERLRESAEVLSVLRREAGVRLSHDVGEHLSRMGLPSDGFTIRFERLDPLRSTSEGADRAEFLVSLNPGEPPASLAGAASGGEASRLLLAIKLALRGADPIGTSVFDEVDAGVGGEAAVTVGTLLRELSAETQVLCVTHLPQVAACADHHVRLEKSVADGRTRTIATRVDGDARVEEVARMLGGDSASQIGLAHAKEMIAGGR